MIFSVAWAGSVVGGAVLYDTPSEQFVVGPHFAEQCETTEGFCWSGRLAAGVDLRGNGAGGVVDLGGMYIVPTKEDADIRIGVGTRGVFIQRDLPIVLQFDDATDVRWGMVPQAFLQGEMQWHADAPLVVGGTVGAAPWASYDPACREDSQPRFCVRWNTSFVGTFYGRKTFRNGFVMHAGFGTLVEAGLGWRL